MQINVFRASNGENGFVISLLKRYEEQSLGVFPYVAVSCTSSVDKNTCFLRYLWVTMKPVYALLIVQLYEMDPLSWKRWYWIAFEAIMIQQIFIMIN